MGLWLPKQKPPRGTILNPSHPLSKGMVCCFVFNEATGGRLFDLASYRHHGTINGTVRWLPGGKGYGLDYVVADNGAGYVSIPNDARMIPGTADFSLFFLLRSDTQDDNGSRFYAKGNHGEDYIHLYVDKYYPGKIIWQDGPTGYEGSLQSTIALTNGEDYAVCAVRRAGTAYIYIDGVDRGSATHAGNFNATRQTELGRSPDYSDTTQWDGALYDFRYYDRGLSPAEVAWLHAEPYAMFRQERRVRWFLHDVGNTDIPGQFMTLGMIG